MENLGEKVSPLITPTLRIKSPLKDWEDFRSWGIATDIKKGKGFLKTGQCIILKRRDGTAEDGSSHLSSVHKLLSCIIIHSKNFQKWVRLTEEILQ